MGNFIAHLLCIINMALIFITLYLPSLALRTVPQSLYHMARQDESALVYR